MRAPAERDEPRVAGPGVVVFGFVCVGGCSCKRPHRACVGDRPLPRLGRFRFSAAAARRCWLLSPAGASERPREAIRLIHPDGMARVGDRVELRGGEVCNEPGPHGGTKVHVVVRADDHTDRTGEGLQGPPEVACGVLIVGIFEHRLPGVPVVEDLPAEHLAPVATVVCVDTGELDPPPVGLLLIGLDDLLESEALDGVGRRGAGLDGDEPFVSGDPKRALEDALLVVVLACGDGCRIGVGEVGPDVGEERGALLSERGGYGRADEDQTGDALRMGAEVA